MSLLNMFSDHTRIKLESGIPSSGLRQPCTRHTLCEQSEDWSLVSTQPPQPGVLLQQHPAGHFTAALSTQAGRNTGTC